MKAFYFLIPLFMVNACKTQTGTVISSDKTTMEKSENKTSDCPEDGTCGVVIHKNTKLDLDDDGPGKLYPQIVEGENIVVEFTYRRPGPEGTADGNYLETIHFEVPSETKDLVRENGDLADLKMLFGILAYRNATYYPLTKGKLVLKKTDNTLSFDLRFKVDQTSQVISHIKETVKL